MDKTAIVIGSGFAGLSAASFLAKDGWKVTVLEKHSSAGGRARQWREGGFIFDMGPSWYWMPDVFESYFQSFGKKVSEFYNLKRLDPSYRIFTKDGSTDIPAGEDALSDLFELWEKGAAQNLKKFLEEAAYKYRVGMQKLVYKPGLSVKEFVDSDVMKGIFRIDLFRSMSSHVSKYFKDERIRQIMEFPVLFLGALPSETPALYSLMNYADIAGGTWYPEGGMYSIVTAMHQLATELGVDFRFSEEVTALLTAGNKITGVNTIQNTYHADVVVSGADYHFTEQQLLPAEARMYTEKYWNGRQMAPSCLLYYVGISKKLKNLRHHNLFFDTDFNRHGQEIYETKTWPSEPLFYLSVTSLSDNTVAPAGYENLFLLIPVAAGLDGDDEALREHYFRMIMTRLEKHTEESITDHIVFKKTFGPSDFASEYHSFKGNAYGLANTLRQTSILKPRCRSSKIRNLYFTGQLTVPGPGVPPALISGELVANVISGDKKINA